jgi:hypothetical protein
MAKSTIEEKIRELVVTESDFEVVLSISLEGLLELLENEQRVVVVESQERNIAEIHKEDGGCDIQPDGKCFWCGEPEVIECESCNGDGTRDDEELEEGYADCEACNGVGSWAKNA